MQGDLLDKCVLIVDDLLPFCKLVKKKLEEAGLRNAHFVNDADSAVYFIE
jgi:hypothetical protein